MSIRDKLSAIAIPGDLFPDLTWQEKLADRLTITVLRALRGLPQYRPQDEEVLEDSLCATINETIEKFFMAKESK